MRTLECVRTGTKFCLNSTNFMVHCCIIVHGKHSSSCFKMFQKSEQQQVIDISLVINYQHFDSADNNLNDLINIQLKLVWIELVRAIVS